MKKNLLTLAGFAAVAWTILLATRLSAQPPAPAPRSKPTDTAPTAATIRGTVRSIQMPQITPELPPGPHHDEVLVFCGMCHTPRYITIQPPFPRKTWLAEVTKMRTSFSAPIPEEKVEGIVDYLMSVRGTPEAPPKPH